MVIMMQCVFIEGPSKSIFSKYYFGREGVAKKDYSVYAFDNVDNSRIPDQIMDRSQLSTFSV